MHKFSPLITIPLSPNSLLSYPYGNHTINSQHLYLSSPSTKRTATATYTSSIYAHRHPLFEMLHSHRPYRRSLTVPTRNGYVEGPCNHCFRDGLGEMVENNCTKSRCTGCRGKRKRWGFEDKLSEVEGEEAEADPREGKENLVKM